MKTPLAILLVLLIACGGTAFAKKHHKSEEKFPILEVNALAITVSVGNDGNLHETYKITTDTKVTIDGAPATARDLLAGMLAAVDVADDKTTARSIDASDPKAVKNKRR